MAGHYKQRLETHIQEVLTDLIAREVRDPRVAGVVITAVELNDDLSVARVFYMRPVGVEADVAAGLRRAAAYLRGEVGRFLRMRTAPELRWREDRSLDRYNRIAGILAEAGAADPADAAATGGAGEGDGDADIGSDAADGG
ncbi:MAG: 30S ribosome-binding factor RbfA [Candidatus Krumholzibacteriota bacterium]|nr:30S ribosome-binding factor RbfA [Candidatus Krumholzibacteriota bacterium]